MNDRRSLLLIPVLALIAFGPVVTFDFVWDDKNLILHNGYLDQPETLYRAFRHGFWELTNAPQHVPMYRPLVIVSYYLEKKLWGDSAAGYHATNLALHALNALLVGLMAAFVVRKSKAALPAALLFLSHPVQYEAVANIASRTDLMATGLGVGATLLWLGVGREEDKTGLRRAGALGLLALALLAKESAVVWPLIWPVLRAAREGRWRLIAADAIPIVVLVVYAALRSSVMSEAVPVVAPEVWQGPYRLFMYAGRVLWPSLHSPTYEPPSATGLETSILAVVWLGVGAWTLLRARPVVRAGLIAAVLAIGPAAEIIPVGARFSDLLLYTPMVFGSLLVGYAGARSRWAWGAAIAVGLLCLPISAARTEHFRNDLSLWSFASERDPASSMAALNHANALRGAGRGAEGCAALSRLRAAMDQPDPDPYLERVEYNLGNCTLESGDPAAAEIHFARAFELSNHGLWQAGQNRALALMQLGRNEEALGAAEAVVAAHPEMARAHETRAILLAQAGRFAEALSSAERALALDPTNTGLPRLVEQLRRDRAGQR